ncbi:nucleotide-diphospho-sugar transferase, partial [Morchella snyderi]
YFQLLLNDNYLPGAQVLAHSLRDGSTRKKLAVMVTLSGVKPATVTELKRLYEYVIPVEPIFNETPANLDLIDRLDLNAAFTKINVWKQTQFRKIVFIDADVVAMRAPDELFDVDADFAAAPDIGWPDCFNSGVMLLKPDAGTYFSLLQLAGRGVSFDGADQGLFNTYFRNFHRLSFTYNCTPSASYQYVPAFRHYGSQISLAHFIGAEKPWTIGRSSSSQQTGTPYDQLLGQWWAVWDKHFRPVLEDAKTGRPHGTANGNYNNFQQVYSAAPFVAGGHQEEIGKHPEIASGPGGFQHQHQQQYTQHAEAPLVNAQPQPQQKPFYGAFPDSVMTPHGPVPQAKYFETGPQSFLVQEFTSSGAPISEHLPHKYDGRMEGSQQGSVVYSEPAHSWDPAKSAPPARSAPEARHLPLMSYMNEWDKQPEQRRIVSAPTPPPVFKERARPQVEVKAPEDDIRPIFPWEKKPRRTSRVFADEIPDLDEDDEAPEEAVEETIEDLRDEDWKDYTRKNQWDAVPGIQDYVSDLKRHRKDFQPSETAPRVATKYDSDTVVHERPPLPITPAPIRRTGPHWLSASDEKFPSAAGIPSQEDWDPHAKLEELRGLPPAFIANILAKGTSTNETQTDNGNSAAVDVNRIEAKPIERQAAPMVALTEPEPVVVYSTTQAQTEAPQMRDSGTQWENEDWDEETVAPSPSSTQPQTPTQEMPAMTLQPAPAPVAKKVEAPAPAAKEAEVPAVVAKKVNDNKSREILEETVLNKSPESKVAFVLHREKAQNNGSGDADIGTSAKGKADD